MSLLDSAMLALKYGFAVFPLWPRTKNPCGELVPHGVVDATTDPAQVFRWWSLKPACNVAVTNGVIIDCDSGLSSLQDAKDFAAQHRFPPTLAIRTGRRTSYGIQFHFSGQADSGKYNAFGISGEIRAHHLYGLFAGSVHPDTGELYEIVIDCPRAMCPQDILSQFRVDRSARPDGGVYAPMDYESARETYFRLLHRAAHATRGGRHAAAHRCAWFGARAILAGIFEEWTFGDIVLYPRRSEREIKKEIYRAVKSRYERGERNLGRMLGDSWESGVKAGRLSLELYSEDYELLQSLTSDVVFHNAWSGITTGFDSALAAKQFLLERLTAAGAEDPQRIVRAGDLMPKVAEEILLDLQIGQIIRGDQ